MRELVCDAQTVPDLIDFALNGPADAGRHLSATNPRNPSQPFSTEVLRSYWARTRRRRSRKETSVFRPFLVESKGGVGYTRRTAGTTDAFHIALLTGGTVTFEVGDKVIYPNHGLGIVERIEDKTILGTTCGFYHLRIVANDTTVLVPVSNVDGVGLRRAIGDEDVERLFGLLSDGKIDNHQNWKGRFKDNSDKMRSGSIYEVADVLKSLTFLAKSKSLSFREKRMLDRGTRGFWTWRGTSSSSARRPLRRSSRCASCRSCP